VGVLVLDDLADRCFRHSGLAGWPAPFLPVTSSLAGPLLYAQRKPINPRALDQSRNLADTKMRESVCASDMCQRCEEESIHGFPSKTHPWRFNSVRESLDEEPPAT
jgi:hypothetical protein